MDWRKYPDEKPKQNQFCLIRLEVADFVTNAIYQVRLYRNSEFVGVEKFDDYKITHWTEFNFAVEDDMLSLV